MKRDSSVRRKLIAICRRSAFITLLFGAFLFLPYGAITNPGRLASASNEAHASETRAVANDALFTFNTPAAHLPEAGSLPESWSPYFWVNSGGYFRIEDSLGKTVQGALPASDPWRVLYALTDPLDTGNGFYPQNIFRLVTRSSWTDDTQQMQFKIQHTNLTDTPNRDGYSGILFFSRYEDSDNLYYAGVRMDGTAVIKKKVGGVYYTMAEERVFPGIYDKQKTPTLLPQKKWMGMRLATESQADGSVALTLSLDQDNTGGFKEVAHAIDSDGRYGGTLVISGPAHVGIRTDYMDVFFNDYRITATTE